MVKQNYIEHWEKKTQRKSTSYWYYTEIEECVLCGRSKSYKERIYDRPKPENPGDRIILRQNACYEHFI